MARIIKSRFIFDKELNKVVEITPQESMTEHHAIHQDSMEPTKHPITGEIFTSKSKFREVTRAHGYIEIGNESREIKETPVKENHESEKRSLAYLRGEGAERVNHINNYIRRLSDEHRRKRG